MYCSQHEYEYFLYTTGNRNFSNVFFSKNILFYNMIVYIIVILWYSIFCIARLTVSTNVFVQRVTETSNVFFSNPYLVNWLTGYLTFWLTDWLEIWRSSPNVSLSREPWISKSDVFFLIFFYRPKYEKQKENRYFNFEMLPLFLIFEISLFPWFMR